MKEVIFCNSLNRAKKILRSRKNKEYKYFTIKYDKESYSIENLLIDSYNFQRCSVREIREKFQGKFVDFVAKINKNNHSLTWWCLNFTNKNPITTDLCDKAFNFLVIVHSLLNENNLFVITDDTTLIKQVSNWSKQKGVKVFNLIKAKISFKKIIKIVMPGAILFAFFRTIIFKAYSKIISKSFIFQKNTEYLALLSLINHQSFSSDRSYLDTYFGKLPNYFKSQKLPLIIIGEVLFPPYKSILKKASNNKEGFSITSKEYFISFTDLIICLFHSLFKFFKPIKIKGTTDIGDIDIGFLVKKTIREDYSSTKFFNNLCIFYCIKGAVKLININKFYYPFENRAFEKMVVLSLRRYSPKTRIIAYQHASISQRHTNFFQGKEEVKITPMPDTIITMGQITKEILKDKGNFPETLLRIGCALRQQSNNGKQKEKPNKISNIFVALATSIDEYVKVLKFLDQAIAKNDQYKIWIRPHPVFSLEEAMEISGKPKFNFYKANKETLEDCYKWADIVLYVHSTLSLQALTFGIPVMNIVTEDCLNPDPLFNFSDLRWVISDPKKLVDTISLIDSIREDEFLMRQKKAKEYAKKYIYPTTETNLKVFANA